MTIPLETFGVDSVDSASSRIETVDVETPNGTLRGRVDGDLLRFRGVRYARASRFELPVAEHPWQGVREAQLNGPMCPQPPFGLALLALPKPVPPMDEDCFFLTITAPATGTAKKPVMVWIHGGAYVNGSGSGDIYDSARIVRDGDVIVVGVNYRLGVFGYLAIDGVAPANLGVADQLEALRWVKTNIASFGGDPDSITVFGQSAGADAIAHLLSIPEADGLFSRAILQSPPLGLDRERQKLSPQLTANVLRALGEDPVTAPVERMLAAQVAATQGLSGDRLTAGMPYAPTPGAWPISLPERRQTRWRARAASVDVLIGYNRDDFTPFLDAVPALRRARARSVVRPATEPLSRILTNRVFGAPTLELARLLAGSGAHVYTYRFDWRPRSTVWGACHCIELPFFWADEEFWQGSPMLGGVDWADLDELGSRLRRAWAAFARSGVPVLDGQPGAWAEVSDEHPIGVKITFDPRYSPRSQG
ncbi:carboxylesterase family protein [Subtercola sp. PAMC28395]|uniref:carboxylesterase/lipase family protein n=1 Tax=Subtercola sp. PAMC28395 TaxID=2846775 RepID=UPI001C0E1531|nr:carboxylesterase family protein [Subtercola sp. PAMC28395]QWT23496.1 carboxylesterase family protein [Subtercola sp. PAMC28395]